MVKTMCKLIETGRFTGKIHYYPEPSGPYPIFLCPHCGGECFCSPTDGLWQYCNKIPRAANAVAPYWRCCSTLKCPWG